MKKLMVIAIALVSVNAFATRARMNSLGNSYHIMDTQRIYMNPSDMFSFGDFVNLESGVTSDNSLTEGTNAEGMIVRTMGDSKLGLSIGHRSANAASFGLRATTLFGNYFAISNNNQQNPIEVSYGMKMGDAVYAGTLVYSNYNDKKNEQKESSLGVRFGGRMGAIDFSVAQGIDSKMTSGTAVNYKGKANTGLFAGYTMDNNYFYGEIKLAGAEETVAGRELKSTSYKAGMTSSVKKDGSEFFYGVALASVETTFTTTALGSRTNKSLNLPLTLGFEADAASWLTVRGSITQTQFIAQDKKEYSPASGATINTESDPSANNTVASIGAGLKFNKVTLDGSLSGLTGSTAGQQLDGNTLLSQVGFTYMF